MTYVNVLLLNMLWIPVFDFLPILSETTIQTKEVPENHSLFGFACPVNPYGVHCTMYILLT